MRFCAGVPSSWIPELYLSRVRPCSAAYCAAPSPHVKDDPIGAPPPKEPEAKNVPCTTLRGFARFRLQRLRPREQTLLVPAALEQDLLDLRHVWERHPAVAARRLAAETAELGDCRTVVVGTQPCAAPRS